VRDVCMMARALVCDARVSASARATNEWCERMSIKQVMANCYILPN